MILHDPFLIPKVSFDDTSRPVWVINLTKIERIVLILLWHSTEGSNGACSVRHNKFDKALLFAAYGASSVATFLLQNPECQSRTKLIQNSQADTVKLVIILRGPFSKLFPEMRHFQMIDNTIKRRIIRFDTYFDNSLLRRLRYFDVISVFILFTISC